MIPRWRNFSRGRAFGQAGASILAALVFVAVLGAIAVMVEGSVSVNPQSQGAAVEGSVQGNKVCVMYQGKLNCGEQTQSKVCKPGYDYLVNEAPNAPVPTLMYWPVCPAPPDTTEGIPQTGGFKDGAGKTNFGAGWGSGDARCESRYDANGKKVYVPVDAPKWKCRTLTCAYPPGQGGQLFGVPANSNIAKTLPPDVKSQCTDWGESSHNGIAGLPSRVFPSNLEPLKTIGCDDVCKIASAQGLNDPESKTLNDVLKEYQATKSYAENYCALNPDEAETCLANQKSLETAEAGLKKIAEENEGIANQDCSLLSGSEAAACKATQARAQENFTKINDSLKNDRFIVEDETKNTDKYSPGDVLDKDTYCLKSVDIIRVLTVRAGTPFPSDCCNGTNAGSLSQCKMMNNGPYSGPPNNGYNNTFGNGQNPFGQQGQSALPMSPLTGGQCTQGYVCVNNTLYNQAPVMTSQNPIVYQCLTQPMQQCQYGCMQPQQQQQTGAQSMMTNVSQGLGVLSSVMKLFGGGGSTQQQAILPAQNVSNACATQPQNQYGTGTNGQPCTQPQPPQPDPAQCTVGAWKPTSQQQNGCITGYQCVPNGTSAGPNTPPSGPPTAQLSCQPKNADVGMTIGFSFSCGNADASAGAGFDTKGALSGTSTAIVAPPDDATTATYTLTCVNQGVTASSQCVVQVGKASIVLVASPKKVQANKISTIGWITSGMTSCVVSSPDQPDFTQRNAGITVVNGAATTSPITKNSVFNLNCDTLGGGTKQASSTIELL